MPKARILIVEDSFIVAFHLQKTLEKEGYIVIGTVPSGEAALKLLLEEKPDIVLMDIMLTGKLDGIETARSIRAQFSIPVVYITALTDKETIQRAKVTEPYGYLTKPFEDREIFTVIEMAVYKHSIEMRLKQSEEKFFSTVAAISDGVVVIDDQYRINYVNPSAERLLGKSNAALALVNVFAVLSLKDLQTGESGINPFQIPLLKGSVAAPRSLAVMDANGVEKPIEWSMSPLVDPRGATMGMVLSMKDISEKVANERLLREIDKLHRAALLEGQEKERSRIAKDLHDGLGQMLNAIKMKVNLLRNETEQTEELYHLIDDAIQESVRISENLLPAKLRDFDLKTCLRSLCNNLTKVSSTCISFEAFGEPLPLEQIQKVNVYRIAQEAISNALKHAHAENIIVQLNEEPDHLQLTVEDDGKGFDLGAAYDKSTHHGLVNMRERVELMGGSLNIESDATRGTLVVIDTPFITNNSTYAEA